MLYDKTSARRKNIEEFSTEVLEQLQRIENGLLLLPINYDVTKIHQLTNTTNFLRRGVAALGWTSLETLAVALRDSLQVCEQQALDISQDLHKLLLQAYLCLRIPVLAQIQPGFCDIMPALSRAKFVYRQLTDELGLKQALEGNSLVHISESDVEINGKLLSIGIMQWMRETESIVAAHTSHLNLVKVLMMKAAILESMGEYFGFSGIVVAGRNMLAALESSNQEPLYVAQNALHTLQGSQDLTLVTESELNVLHSLDWPAIANPESADSNTPSPAVVATKIDTKQFVCLVDSIVLTLPFQNIAEIVSPQMDKIKQVDNKRFVYWKGQMLLIHRLLDLVEWLPLSTSNHIYPKSILIFQQENQFLALELYIERLMNANEISIQSLSAYRRCCLGTTILKDNQLSFVIDGLSALKQKISGRN
jgi:chemotaxis protein histidine kinase CheA